MPTVLIFGPYRFYFYSHEPNEPPHIEEPLLKKEGILSQSMGKCFAFHLINSSAYPPLKERDCARAAVHIDRDNLSAKFWLKKVAVAENMGFKQKELNTLHELVSKHQKQFLGEWNGYFSS